MKSIRRQLLAGAAAATIVVFTAAAASFYWLARSFLVTEIDAALHAKAEVVASLVEFGDGRMGLDAKDLSRFPEYVDGPVAEYYQIQSADGKWLARSPTLKRHNTDRFSVSASPQFITLPDGRPGRTLSILTTPQLDPDEIAAIGGKAPALSVTVAKATTELDRLLARLRRLLLIVCGGGAVILVVAMHWLIRGGLGPVDRVASQIASIGASALEQRIGTDHVPLELAPIVTRLNGLLARLHDSFEREKSFTADAAHELRTPLAGLQAALEVCASQPRDAGEYSRVVQDCLSVVRQMHAMVDNLLLLATADAENILVEQEATDVGAILRGSLARQSPRIDQRHLHVDLRLNGDGAIVADREKLRIILDNLVDNAVQHADDSGQIRVWTHGNNGLLEISIANTGSKIAPADAPRVFERFWRGDKSRGIGKHCGLGLSVCRKLAAAVGATIRARSSKEGWFTVELQVPRQPATST